MQITRDWPHACDADETDFIRFDADIGFDMDGEPVASFRGIDFELTPVERDAAAFDREEYFRDTKAQYQIDTGDKW